MFVYSEKISLTSNRLRIGAVLLVLEVRDWLGRGVAICVRRQRAYTRSVEEGYAQGDPEIEAESGKDFEVEEWRAC